MGPGNRTRSTLTEAPRNIQYQSNGREREITMPVVSSIYACLDWIRRGRQQLRALVVTSVV